MSLVGARIIAYVYKTDKSRICKTPIQNAVVLPVLEKPYTKKSLFEVISFMVLF
jgi:hypothetical protein